MVFLLLAQNKLQISIFQSYCNYFLCDFSRFVFDFGVLQLQCKLYARVEGVAIGVAWKT